MSQQVFKKTGIFYELKNRFYFTPDWLELRESNKIPLFVYDSMMSKFSKNKLVNNGIYLGEARTVTDRFVLRETMNGYSALAFKEDTNPKYRGYIKGEVYALNPEDFFTIDRNLANGIMFSREYRNILLLDQVGPFKAKHRPSMRCMVYIANPDYWDNHHIRNCSYVVDRNNKRKEFLWREPSHMSMFDEPWGPY